jgi:hypothetical protein
MEGLDLKQFKQTKNQDAVQVLGTVMNSSVKRNLFMLIDSARILIK